MVYCVVGVVLVDVYAGCDDVGCCVGCGVSATYGMSVRVMCDVSVVVYGVTNDVVMCRDVGVVARWCCWFGRL